MFSRLLRILFVALIFIVSNECPAQYQQIALETNDLKIIPIAENVWIHETYLATEQWGRVACNGLIYRSENEVALFDTPITDEVSKQLIQWVRDSLQSNITAVIVNHHHIDCLGGLQAFHQLNIPSYAHPLEIEHSELKNNFSPIYPTGSNGLDTLTIGSQLLINYYPGPGHTSRNLISYIPEQQVIFAGCMIKSLGADKGNLSDADTLQWAQSVNNIIKTFSQARLIVPGHGKVGDQELLKYTKQLYEY